MVWGPARWRAGSRDAARVHLADVDGVGAGRIAGVDAAVEPGQGVDQHRGAGHRGAPAPLGEAVALLEPGEAVRERRLLLSQDVDREHRSLPLEHLERLVAVV